MLNLEDKKIILFGASRLGHIILKNLWEYNLKPSYFVDNDSKKWGGNLGNLLIQPPNKLLEEDKKNVFVFISSSFISDISHQLEEYGYINNKNYFCGNGPFRNIPVYITIKQKIFLINLGDNRIFNNFFKNNTSHKRLITFWEDSVVNFKPDVVIDVGANYGECLFSTEYNSNVEMYGIEANPDLISYLNETLRIQKRNNVKIVNAIAGSQVSRREKFYVNKFSSGLSSVFDDSESTKVLVDKITVDDLVSFPTNKKILFKIDVEGYEYEVLKGMKNTLSQSQDLIGFIEFDKQLLIKNKVDINQYFNYLINNYKVFCYRENKVVTDIDSIKDLLLRRGVHTDLILKRNNINTTK